MPHALVLDAVHPDESPAGEACDALHISLTINPLRHVASTIGNVAAYTLGVQENGLRPRLIGANLVSSAPNPLGNFEERRHAELARVFRQYDLVADRHGSRQRQGDYAFCHVDASELVWNAIYMLGLRRVVHYGRPHFAGRYQNYFGMDLGPDSPLNVPSLRERLAALARGERAAPLAVERYISSGSITSERAAELALPEAMDPFEPFECDVAKQLGYPPGVVAIHANRRLYRHTGSYAEVAVPLALAA